MSMDFYLEHYDSILREVIRWRAVPLFLLQDLSGYSGTKTSFCRVIRNLEAKGLLKAGHFSGMAKVVYPTAELAAITKSKGILIQEESLSHEAMVTLVCCELLTWEVFKGSKLPHEVSGRGLDEGVRRLPDAVLEGTNMGRPFKLALEMEISRKSKIRVKNKIEDYLNNNVFEYVLYLFNDRGTYEGYKRILLEVMTGKDVKKSQQAEIRFMFGFKPKFISHNCRLQDIELFYRGKLTSLESVFGKKRG
ncbi:MAG TPA: hypothetical protein VNJ08_05410 [Bacteriovoracaceae bacterium]|nr:hypothetical protein [Bacteriovoracaceae bacterium]